MRPILFYSVLLVGFLSASIANAQTPTCTLTASPTSIASGETSRLTWTTENAESASISQGVGTVFPLGGNQDVNPTETTTYTLNLGGSFSQTGSCSVTVTVDSVTAAPTCTLTASPASIMSGETSKLTWTVENASGASISPGIGTVWHFGGNQDVNPTETTTYTLDLDGAFGQTGSCATSIAVESSSVEPPETTFVPSRFVKCEGKGCSACNLVEIGNEVIVWLFGIIFLLFAILMAAAGFGLVTSGGNPSALNAAKDKFTNAMIGLLIVMSAWLIVDTLMRSLVGGGETGAIAGEMEGWGPWSKVKCQVQAKSTTPTATSGSGGVTATTTATTTASGACPVPPLSPITDEFARRMEAGERIVFNNPNLEACANKFIRSVGGGTITSAYRPQAYQTHLWEIKDRWCTRRLNVSTDPVCAAVRSDVAEHVRSHFKNPPEQWACGEVARTNSTHGSGIGVDISGINHSSAEVRSKASAACLVWKDYDGDPYHYDLDLSISGCSCN